VAEDPGTPSTGVQAAGTQGMLAPGSRVAGYVIEEQIGAGGMAVVYRARDEVLGRLVAVKVLSPALASDEEFRTRFLRESRAVASVDESHIVPVYGAGDAGGVLYIASRFVADGDLSRVQRAANGPLPPAQVADIVSQVASALDAAHAIGLVHRDVKPGNILIERIPGRPEHAYLSDFGLSKSTSAGATGLTATGRFMGTPDYCAPEQITGTAVDGRADQYSLACVAFSLLAGIVPFSRGDSLSRLFAHVNSPVPVVTSIRPELPPALNGVLARGMAKNPAERYESCAAFAAALRGALGIGPGTAQVAAPPPPPPVPFPAQGNMGYQQTITAGGWQHPSVPPGPGGWQGGQASSNPPGAFQQSPATGFQNPPGVYRQNPPAGFQQNPPGAYQQSPPAGFHQGAGGMGGPAPAWPQGPGRPPGPGQPLPGPGQGQRPPRKHTGLIVGGSAAAAAVLIVGVVLGITLSSNNGNTDGTQGSTTSAGATSPSAGGTTASSSSSAGQGDHTGTAVPVGTLTGPGLMRFAFFSTDGNDVAAAGSNADIYVFSAETMKRTQTLSVPTGDVAYPVSFSADDKTLYAMDGTAGKLYVFDIATGKATHVYTYTGVSSPGYTHGGSVYAIETSSSGTVAVYEMATNKLSAQVSNPGKAPIAVAGVTTDGDGKYILISDTDGVSYLVAAQSKAVIGTFHYTYSGNSTIYPQLSLDGNTVYVPGGSSAPAKLWDRATRNYVTPTDARWPALDNGVTFSTDSRFVITSPSSATETVDVWNVATHAHVITLTVPGGANEGVEGIGPGASELLSTASLDINAGTFPKLNIWSIPS